jgi:hypothetical protein
LDDWEAEADENQREKPAVRNRRDIEQVKKEREELKRQEELKKVFLYSLKRQVLIATVFVRL